GSVELAARAAALAASAQEIEGVLALRVLTPDPQLSTPLPSEDPAARVLDPVLIIDATTEPAAAAARSLAEQLELPTDGIQTFHLLWDLRADDLRAAP
ncbi:hypothetical protein ABFO09_01005, partial [Bordetella pertussis]